MWYLALPWPFPTLTHTNVTESPFPQGGEEVRWRHCTRQAVSCLMSPEESLVALSSTRMCPTQTRLSNNQKGLMMCAALDTSSSQVPQKTSPRSGQPGHKAFSPSGDATNMWKSKDCSWMRSVSSSVYQSRQMERAATSGVQLWAGVRLGCLVLSVSTTAEHPVLWSSGSSSSLGWVVLDLPACSVVNQLVSGFLCSTCTSSWRPTHVWAMT